MSGKYMATDLKVERILGNEDAYISVYLNTETREKTKRIFCVMVNKKYSMEKALEIARKELDSKGFEEIPLTTCFKGRLGYDEDEECLERDTWGEYVTEVMWIINLN